LHRAGEEQVDAGHERLIGSRGDRFAERSDSGAHVGAEDAGEAHSEQASLSDLASLAGDAEIPLAKAIEEGLDAIGPVLGLGVDKAREVLDEAVEEIAEDGRVGWLIPIGELLTVAPHRRRGFLAATDEGERREKTAALGCGLAVGLRLGTRWMVEERGAVEGKGADLRQRGPFTLHLQAKEGFVQVVALDGVELDGRAIGLLAPLLVGVGVGWRFIEDRSALYRSSAQTTALLVRCPRLAVRPTRSRPLDHRADSSTRGSSSDGLLRAALPLRTSGPLRVNRGRPSGCVVHLVAIIVVVAGGALHGRGIGTLGSSIGGEALGRADRVGSLRVRSTDIDGRR
jgi:hypothetical protein